MALWIQALVVVVFCIAHVRGAGADANYAALEAYVQDNAAAIAALGSSPVPVTTTEPFPCQLVRATTGDETPTSVHKLRPSDIRIVGAIGDSLTAAFGAEARNGLDLFREYRGVSWSAGGQDTVETRSTMPNILKKFSPDLYGFAIGNGGPNTENAMFNIAVTGAIASDLPAQARSLVGYLAESPHVNFTDDWKVLTVFIGGNDLCSLCNDPTYYSAENYEKYLLETITILQGIPRVYLNLVSMMDIVKLTQLNDPTCLNYHKTVCKCVTQGDEALRQVTAAALQYQAVAERIGQLPQFQTETFAVNVQPFYIDTQIPLEPDGAPDYSYFAPDCFHFSAKSHYAAGVALWNNMLQPAGSKAKAWAIGAAPLCPTSERPYLCTATNKCGAAFGLLGTVPQSTAAPPTLSIDQKTMLGLALVIVVAVPAAILALYRYQRARRAGYTPIDGQVAMATTAV
eukprot:m.227561 g.227561  ORF g.227561 m.227561 type:complete len:457 (+) comp11607_c0_seq1:82-1452(+)